MRYVWFFVHTSVSFDLRIFRCATTIITFYWNSCFQSTWICFFLLFFAWRVWVCSLMSQCCWLLVCGCHKSNVNRREVNSVHSEKAFEHCVIRCQSDCIDTAGNSSSSNSLVTRNPTVAAITIDLYVRIGNNFFSLISFARFFIVARCHVSSNDVRIFDQNDVIRF